MWLMFTETRCKPYKQAILMLILLSLLWWGLPILSGTTDLAGVTVNEVSTEPPLPSGSAGEVVGDELQ